MVGNPNAWWGTEPIHGGEATYMVAWPASRPALVGARLDGSQGGRSPVLPNKYFFFGTLVGCAECKI